MDKIITTLVLLILFTGVFFGVISCSGGRHIVSETTQIPGPKGEQGVAGPQGEDGLTTLVTSARVTIPAAMCTAESGVIIEHGRDTNRNGTLEPSEVEGYTYVCDGNEAVLPDMAFVDFVDPCGDNPGQFDEVLMLTQGGDYISYFESGGNRFLTVLECNRNYQTTDAQSCSFSINAACEYEE